MKPNRTAGEEGFTLVEVLAATVILAVVSLGMMTFFIQAMSYNKGSQNKTVMVHLARNTLFYMQKQSFDALDHYFTAAGSGAVITTEGCTHQADASNHGAGTTTCLSSSELEALFNQTKGLWETLTPVVNNRTYQITVTKQEALAPTSRQNQAPLPGSDYLIPIRVMVTTDDFSRKDHATVEGYIADESIR